MTQLFFTAGTDTDVGKTTIACLLLKKWRDQGFSTAALKPIASGCEATPQGLRSNDALLLQQAASHQLDYQTVNPIAYQPAIAPHIACDLVNDSLSVARIIDSIKPTLSLPVDYMLIEGAGGWLTPLNATETYADVVKALKIPVILVIGMRLGCLNHGLLTVKAIEEHVPLAGWVANCIQPSMPYLAENIAYLKQNIKSPLLFTNNYESLDNAQYHAIL